MTVEPWQSVPDLGMFWWYFPASPLMCCTPLTGPGKKTCNTLFNPMGSGGISKEIFKTLQSESHLFQLGHLLPDFPLGFSKVALLCFYVEGSHLGREVVVLKENENQENMFPRWRQKLENHPESSMLPILSQRCHHQECCRNIPEHLFTDQPTHLTFLFIFSGLLFNVWFSICFAFYFANICMFSVHVAEADCTYLLVGWCHH